MSEDELKTAMGTAIAGCFLAVVAILLGLLVMLGAKDDGHALQSQITVLTDEVYKRKSANCEPTPAPCCKADHCRKELAQVDARFGDVWDELFEVHEQLAKVKPCACQPSKPCACTDKPACECKPQPKTQLPVHRVLKRCN